MLCAPCRSASIGRELACGQLPLGQAIRKANGVEHGDPAPASLVEFGPQRLVPDRKRFTVLSNGQVEMGSGGHAGVILTEGLKQDAKRHVRRAGEYPEPSDRSAVKVPAGEVRPEGAFGGVETGRYVDADLVDKAWGNGAGERFGALRRLVSLDEAVGQPGGGAHEDQVSVGPGGDRCSEFDGPLGLGHHVGDVEIDVHPSRAIVGLLKSEVGVTRRGQQRGELTTVASPCRQTGTRHHLPEPHLITGACSRVIDERCDPLDTHWLPPIHLDVPTN